MRIVADIPHPHLKITVFHMNFKYAIKFESPMYEQWYKIRESSQIQNPRDVIRLVDDTMIEEVIRIIGKMHSTNIKALDRLSNKTGDHSEHI